MELTTQNGASRFPAFVGFGNSATSNNPIASPINLTNEQKDYAFIVPRSGILSSLYTLFSTTSPNNFVDTTVTIYAQLYQASSSSNLFTPITNTLIQLQPSYSSSVPTGSITHGSLSNINVNVNAGDRLLLVFSAVASGQILTTTIKGHVSAGLGIT